MQSTRALVACLALASCRFGFSERSELDASVDPDAVADAPEPVHLKIAGYGALTGPGGIACADDCTHPVDGPVTIIAVAGETWKFDHFDSPCGSDPTCTLMPGQTAAATFVPQPITANRVFISSQGATLGPMGRAGLDMLCSSRAVAGGIPGNFVAFVSTTTQDAVDRLAGSRGWVRLDGLPVLDQPTDLGSDALPRGVMYDELMQTGPERNVMTGSTVDGRLLMGNNCSDWTSTAGSLAAGIADGSGRYVSGSISSGCGAGLVLCFEIGKSVPVSMTPPAFPVGRYAFVALGFDTSTGVAGADAHCQAEATAASLPGTYKAVIATAAQSALEHTGPLDGAWRRTDGASITRRGLHNGNFSASLSLTAAGVPTPRFAAQGAKTLTEKATAALSCNDWTTMSGVNVTLSGAFRMSPFETGWQSGCGVQPVVCVQTQ